MTGRSAIDCGVLLLSHVGDNVVYPACLYKVFGIIVFVGCHSGSVVPGDLFDHLKSFFAFAGSRGLGDQSIDSQTVTVFHKHMACE